MSTAEVDTARNSERTSSFKSRTEKMKQGNMKSMTKDKKMISGMKICQKGRSKCPGK